MPKCSKYKDKCIPDKFSLVAREVSGTYKNTISLRNLATAQDSPRPPKKVFPGPVEQCSFQQIHCLYVDVNGFYGKVGVLVTFPGGLGYPMDEKTIGKLGRKFRSKPTVW